MTMPRLDPYRSFNFRLEIDNLPVAAFSDASGMNSDGDVVDYRTGTDVQLTPRKLAGLRRFGPISLSRGMVNDSSLWDWHANIVAGVADRRNGSVILMDEARNDVLRWNFENAWPNKIEGPALTAKGNEIAVEKVELIVESIVLEVV